MHHLRSGCKNLGDAEELSDVYLTHSYELNCKWFVNIKNLTLKILNNIFYWGINPLPNQMSVCRAIFQDFIIDSPFGMCVNFDYLLIYASENQYSKGKNSTKENSLNSFN